MQKSRWSHVMADSRSTLGDSPLSSVLPRRPHLFALAAVYALIVTYGSLVPLDFQAMPFGRVVQRVDEVVHQRLEFRSRSDLLVNIASAIPLGFLLMAGLCADRSRAAALLAAPVVVPACLLFAAGVEFMQLFLPPRVASLTDIASQGVGSCFGVLAWALGGQATIDWCRRVWKANTAPGLARLLLPGYVVLLVLMHMAPFDLMTRPKEAAVKWRLGHIHVVPFQTFYESPIEGLDKTLINFAYFLPVGLLWGLGPHRQKPRGLRVLRAAAAGLLVAGSMEALQLIVISRNFDTTDILTGLLAAVVGAEATAAYCPPHDRPATGRSRVVLGLAILFWLVALMNDYWRPFDFSFDSGRLASGFHRIEWLPLADSHHGDDLQAILHLFDKALLFLVLGALCTLSFADALGRRTGRKVVAAVFVAASILEAGQLFVPTRHFGVTDILVAVSGGWLGYFLVATLTRLANSPGTA
jgi:glycopeptide antibiotics resistance protein